MFTNAFLDTTASGPETTNVGAPQFAKSDGRSLLGRMIQLAVPLKDGAQTLAEISVKIAPGGTDALLPKDALADGLASLVTPDAIAKLKAIPDHGGYVTPVEVRKAGFDLIFDPGLLEVRFTPNADQRPLGSISMSGTRPVSPDGTALAKPAIVSGFVNIIESADYIWTETSGQNGFGGARFDVSAVARMWDVVIENEMTVQTTAASSRDLYGRPIYRFQQNGISRRSTRLTYDLPDQMVRFQVGDTDTFGSGFQNASTVLGVTIEKSPRKLAPNENIRPSGRSSFRVERPAEVDVIVNGAIRHHLSLRPGNYSIFDLPLITGANNVELAITDDTGEKRTLKFTTFFDDKLLATGKNEWSFTGGTPSYLSDSKVTYLTDQWFASGFYRQGLTDKLTGELNLQGDNHTAMGGLGAYLQTKGGFFSFLGSLSHHDLLGSGVAGSVNWDLVNFKGLTGKNESVRLTAEYRSRNFTTAGELTNAAQLGAFDPRYAAVLNPYWLRLSGSYTLPLTETLTATLAARYQFSVAKDTQLLPQLGAYEVFGDRYGVDLTLSAPLSNTASMSLTTGYSNEAYRWTGDSPTSVRGDFRTMLRFYIRPDQHTTVSASYDTLNRSANVSASQSYTDGVDHWQTTVSAQRDGLDSRAGVNGTINYTGNRFEAGVSHSTAFDGVGTYGYNATPSDQRSTARFGTALVFADGQFGVSAPIRGNGFAIVTPHESIASKEVVLGAPDAPRAKSDWLGPAVVRDLPAYTPAVVPVDVADLPIGYDLGSGAYDIVAPYRAGYRLKVGSDHSVSAFGTLLLADGSPVALLTGVAKRDDGTGTSVSIFTNAAGRFGAEGLAPGRWIVEMATDDHPTRFAIVVPAGTQGLYKTGELRPLK